MSVLLELLGLVESFETTRKNGSWGNGQLSGDEEIPVDEIVKKIKPLRDRLIEMLTLLGLMVKFFDKQDGISPSGEELSSSLIEETIKRLCALLEGDLSSDQKLTAQSHLLFAYWALDDHLDEIDKFVGHLFLEESSDEHTDDDDGNEFDDDGSELDDLEYKLLQSCGGARKGTRKGAQKGAQKGARKGAQTSDQKGARKGARKGSR